MTTPALNLLQQAQQAVQRGRKKEAYQLLLQAARQDPQEYRIWLGLAGLAEDPALSLRFVAQAEKLQPADPKVKQAKLWAQQRVAAQPEKAAPAPPRPNPFWRLGHCHPARRWCFRPPQKYRRERLRPHPPLALWSQRTHATG